MCIITSLSATEMACKIKSGEFSVRRVVEAHIARIEEVNPKLNAVVFTLFDQARRDADSADAARKSAEMGPLYGVPVTVKDQFQVKGAPSTLGVLRLKDNIAQQDGRLVARLRRAGAIVLGVTNVPQTLSLYETDNPVYGRTNNPWDLKRTPGGSSGGEAAVIAAGGSPLGLGADLGGSIRIPSHFCGICGLKPTARRLAGDDTPLGGILGREVVIDQPGPMARHVCDLALAMRELVADSLERPRDNAVPVPWREPGEVDVGKLRVAYFTCDGVWTVSPAIRRAVREAVCALRARGAVVEEWMPPEVNSAISLFYALQSADGLASLWELFQGEKPMSRFTFAMRLAKLPHAPFPIMAAVMELFGQRHGARVVRCLGKRSTANFQRLIREILAYRDRFATALQVGEYHAIVCPAEALPAIYHGDCDTLMDFGSYAVLYNLLGMPAGVLPVTRVRAGEESDRPECKDMAERTAHRAERQSAGLPVGVQVAAQHWREDIVLAVMGVLESHFRQQADYPSPPVL